MLVCNAKWNSQLRSLQTKAFTHLNVSRIFVSRTGGGITPHSGVPCMWQDVLLSPSAPAHPVPGALAHHRAHQRGPTFPRQPRWESLTYTVGSCQHELPEMRRLSLIKRNKRIIGSTRKMFKINSEGLLHQMPQKNGSKWYVNKFEENNFHTLPLIPI